MIIFTNEYGRKAFVVRYLPFQDTKKGLDDDIDYQSLIQSKTDFNGIVVFEDLIGKIKVASVFTEGKLSSNANFEEEVKNSKKGTIKQTTIKSGAEKISAGGWTCHDHYVQYFQQICSAGNCTDWLFLDEIYEFTTCTFNPEPPSSHSGFGGGGGGILGFGGGLSGGGAQGTGGGGPIQRYPFYDNYGNFRYNPDNQDKVAPPDILCPSSFTFNTLTSTSRRASIFNIPARLYEKETNLILADIRFGLQIDAPSDVVEGFSEYMSQLKYRQLWDSRDIYSYTGSDGLTHYNISAKAQQVISADASDWAAAQTDEKIMENVGGQQAYKVRFAKSFETYAKTFIPGIRAQILHVDGPGYSRARMVHSRSDC